MSPTDTSEKGLEALIEASLLCEASYVCGESNDYSKTYCVDTTQLFRFLRETQPEAVARLEKAYGSLFEDKLLNRLFDQVQSRGIVEVLRNGIKAGEVALALFNLKKNNFIC